MKHSTKPPAPKPRGFAAMSLRERTAIASMGGTASMSKPRHASKLGKLGGKATQDKIRKLTAANKKGNQQ